MTAYTTTPPVTPPPSSADAPPLPPTTAGEQDQGVMEKGEQWIRQNATAALAASVAVGAVAGLLLKRLR